MDGALLVLNAGLTSIKFAVFQMAGGGVVEKLCRGRVGSLDREAYIKTVRVSDGKEERKTLGKGLSNERALDHILDFTIDELDDVPLVAAAHRFVHGGDKYRKPTKITPSVLLDLEKLKTFSPTHTPRAVDVIWSLLKQNGSMPQIACFDTAFHTTDEQIIHQYALPDEVKDLSTRRFGFHGISYDFVVRQLKKASPTAYGGRTVAAHIGGTSSMCALFNGQSIDYVGGAAKLDGLPSMTSSGTIDPSVVIKIMQKHKLSTDGAQSLLYLHSGLHSLDRQSADFKALLESDRPTAKNAVAFFVYRLGGEIGNMAMSIGGIDAFVFTGAVAEKSPKLRAMVMEKMAWFGATFDQEANLKFKGRKPAKLSRDDSKIEIWVVPTDEERMIAHYAMTVLK